MPFANPEDRRRFDRDRKRREREARRAEAEHGGDGVVAPPHPPAPVQPTGGNVPLPLDTAADALAIIRREIHTVRTCPGDAEVQSTARLVGYLIQTATRLLEMASLEDRLAILEEKLTGTPSCG
jgi:hypothetical protein